MRVFFSLVLFSVMLSCYGYSYGNGGQMHNKTMQMEQGAMPQEDVSKIKEINLEAYQYGFSPDPVVVKKGDMVKFDISSRDVTHGVYIKEYGINVVVKKGEHKKAEFLADKEGNFEIVCSVYCGSGHSGMKGRLIVEK